MYLSVLNDALYFILDILHSKKAAGVSTWLGSMESGAVAIEDKNESKKLHLTMMGTLRDLKAADTELMMNLGTDDGAPLSPRLRRALQNGTATHINGTKVPIGSLDVHGGRYAIPRCALMPVVPFISNALSIM